MSAESVRHHWAPQFLPNLLPTSSARSNGPINTREVNNPKSPDSCHTLVEKTLSPPDTVHLKLKESRRFTLEDFLDAPDPTGRYPSKSNFSNAPSAHLRPHTAMPTPPQATYAEREGALAACRALSSLDLKPATTALDDPTPMEETRATDLIRDVRTSPSACPNSPLGESLSFALFAMDKSLAASPEVAVMPTFMPESTPMNARTLVSMSPSANSSPLISKQHVYGVPAPRSSPFLPPPQSVKPTVSQYWTELSEGITVFRPFSLNNITTASTVADVPCTILASPPAPFIKLPEHPPPVIQKDPFKHPSSSTILARRKRAFLGPSPEERKELDDFLTMGHSNPCWCSTHSKPAEALCASGQTTSPISIPLPPPQLGVVKIGSPSALVNPTGTRSPRNSSQSASESSTFSFDDVSNAMQSSTEDQDKWVVIQPRFLYSTSPDRQTLPLSPPPTPAVPSPPLTLSVSYSEDALCSPWDLSPLPSPVPSSLPSPAIIYPVPVSLQEAEFENWDDWESGSDEIGAGAAEWPTLQEAAKMKPRMKERYVCRRSSSIELVKG